MTSLSRRPVLMLAGLLALTACSTTPPTLVPAAERSGQSWVVTRPALAAELAQACPGGTDSQIRDYWAPTREEVDRLEAALGRLNALGDVSNDDRQYVGVVTPQGRQVYVRGWPASDFPAGNPSREQAVPCDIGWHALYDPASDRFISHRRANAPR